MTVLTSLVAILIVVTLILGSAGTLIAGCAPQEQRTGGAAVGPTITSLSGGSAGTGAVGGAVVNQKHNDEQSHYWPDQYGQYHYWRNHY